MTPKPLLSRFISALRSRRLSRALPDEVAHRRARGGALRQGTSCPAQRRLELRSCELHHWCPSRISGNRDARRDPQHVACCAPPDCTASAAGAARCRKSAAAVRLPQVLLDPRVEPNLFIRYQYRSWTRATSLVCSHRAERSALATCRERGRPASRIARKAGNRPFGVDNC